MPFKMLEFKGISMHSGFFRIPTKMALNIQFYILGNSIPFFSETVWKTDEKFRRTEITKGSF